MSERKTWAEAYWWQKLGTLTCVGVVALLAAGVVAIALGLLWRGVRAVWSW